MSTHDPLAGATLDRRRQVRRTRWLACLFAVVLGAGLGHDLFRMPIQVSDSLGELLEAQAAPSVVSAFARNVTTDPPYIRPLRRAEIKVLFDAADGRYHLVFRGFHVVLLLATLIAFVWALRLETGEDLAAAVFAMAVLVGTTTFPSTVRAAYPINHFLLEILLALVALGLARSGRGWQSDAAAVLVFVVAALTLETGLLVWVVVVAAWLAGFRGVSWRAAAGVSAVLVGYVALRVGLVGGEATAVLGRSTGYLLGVIDPDDVQARFGDNLWPFWAYNVASSLSAVVFSEPRGGTFVAVGTWLRGETPPWLVVRLVSSVLTTLLVAGAIVATATAAFRRRPDDGGRLLFVSVGVIAANAVISYAYTKDDIMSVAGAFYAVAAFVAVRHVLTAPARPAWRTALLSCVLLVASAGWAVRGASLHYILRDQAFGQRNDWADLQPLTRYAAYPHHPGDTPEARALVRQVRQEVFDRPAVSPRFRPRWIDRWFQD
ncbi:MAG: hypothetical protein AB7G23_10150 [Vicinamibacterales bacterium]